MSWQNPRNWFNSKTTVQQKLVGALLWAVVAVICGVAMLLWQNIGAAVMAVVSFLGLVVTVILAFAKFFEAIIQDWVERG